MKKIKLTQGKVALVSDHRFEEFSQWNWSAQQLHGIWYAYRSTKNGSVAMHRQIMGFPEGLQVDHKDGDGLNNQDENLRVCTSTQNQANRGKQKNNTSGYKGVVKARKRWCAQIKLNRAVVFWKSFSTPEEAARAYDEKAREIYGEFAKTNF